MDWQGCARLFLQTHDAGEQDSLKHLTAEQVGRFRANGFLVVDGFLGAPMSSALRRETLALHDRGARSTFDADSILMALNMSAWCPSTLPPEVMPVPYHCLLSACDGRSAV